MSGQSKEFDKEYEYLKDGSPMGHSLDFHGNLGTKLMSPSSIEFHGIRRTPFQMIEGSMGFHRLFHGTLVSPNRISPSSMEFHRTLRTPFSLTSGSLGLPLTSM